jgi:tRNA-dihydrouridine synthase
VDRYFTPFLTASHLKGRELREVHPDNNKGLDVVPQILANDSEQFLEIARQLAELGYKEVNLNLGCPSGTVCAKGKGAGFLPETLALQKFLDDIYSYADSDGMKISVKTRLGYYNPDEFYDLIDIFNAFPISELIVHPRIRTDFYKGEPRREYYAYALEHSRNPLVYNGNIFTVKDYEDLSGAFGSSLDPVMLGRGLISDPSLADKLKCVRTETDFVKLRKLHDTIYHEYQKIMSPDINVLFKMRELWTYWQVLFDGRERDIKKLLKAKKYAEYESIAYSILP